MVNRRNRAEQAYQQLAIRLQRPGHVQYRGNPGSTRAEQICRFPSLFDSSYLEGISLGGAPFHMILEVWAFVTLSSPFDALMDKTAAEALLRAWAQEIPSQQKTSEDQ